MGDAAHAMAPFQGSGAVQSIEDAYILATVLGHKPTTIELVSRALVIYDKLRRPFSSDVALRSMRNVQLCAFYELSDTITNNWE
ncbi:hypothetical protein DEU56DRAFT_6870 [Suillus clintonianus]|uniref:uncharacterized protein n=1 Tax=Suillus clintonianus TaxID=1904413 RepID=UPI001B862838|nr:uncharacterized protein DEU56DRAFT_6870 [Suillus clintonianus]KAG2157162.1 hypothetical protein DEU56DRAFT_6870 [Suillus clintonianus]